MKFVLASHNKKKLRELSDILAGLGVEIVLLPADAPEPTEDGETFEENAHIKARAAAEFTGLPAVADDSGLCVDALDGAPGVWSARYSGGGDEENNAKLLREMEAVPDGKRTARFVCAIACVLPDGREFTVRGACEGVITRALSGDGGFGYDPLFYVPEYGCTFGVLPADVKNRISHRAKALAAFAETLKNQIQE
ncbi:MAG: RdgB/HAM1 family non-canonical purine NTP pyrophosphatase [Butyricicoccus sp.]